MGEQFRLGLRILNSFLLVFGVISIVIGGLSLHFALYNDNPGWPANSGIGVWAGVIVSPMMEQK